MLFQFTCRVALDIPTVEVRFEHLNVGAEAYVGKRAFPSVTNLFLNILEVIHVEIDYLVGISIFNPCMLIICKLPSHSSVLNFNIGR